MSDGDTAPSTAGPTRRAVLRAGGVAWSVPAVVVATAVPAHAVNSPGTGPGRLTGTASASTGFHPGGRPRLDVRGTVRNVGGEPARCVLVVVCTLDNPTRTNALWEGEIQDATTTPPGPPDPLVWDSFVASFSPDRKTLTAQWTMIAPLAVGQVVDLPPFYLLTGGGAPIGVVTVDLQPIGAATAEDPAPVEFTGLAQMA